MKLPITCGMVSLHLRRRLEELTPSQTPLRLAQLVLSLIAATHSDDDNELLLYGS